MDRENPSLSMKMEGQNSHDLMDHLAVTKEVTWSISNNYSFLNVEELED